MRDDQLPKLAAAMQARYLHEQARIRPLLQAEADLRARLAKLDRQVAGARAAADHAVAPMAAVGADLLWQSWVERTRRDLNIELAQAVARKLAAMDQLRVAFGRRQAVGEMERIARARSRARRQRQHDEQLLR